MTGINDIINKHYKEYIERNPNVQHEQTPNVHQDPFRGHACDHDKMMEQRNKRVQDNIKKQKELEQENNHK
ncbi:hypothetical protein DICPUDRAFT_156775 [Dictyostelium purpureum]|uniref:Uncharacterized protein n=1 Tax=Dictyostelium purpureum TaxID=5786 RepID=F0ZXE7_DICPU|nr:uncharacterized protein DICPUDRAFT_156775 [Dictyostelium purpureum]EGC31370.1 hypothetical protein DICPUDRAFT_156775 [Dictyostelium purpureum]|eukprot:XP_003292091.1 hypothetical protein DICPUDRAFT_156775 [Dictyostelium purpureum]